MNKKYVARTAVAISLLAISIIFLIASTTPTVQASPPPTPKITLKPSSGNVGTSVTVTGTGFAHLQTITITYYVTPTSTKIPATIKTNSTGGFTATFIVPTSSVGNHQVTAKDGCQSACACFYVTCLFCVPEYPLGALAALGACFAALLVYKRKSLPHFKQL